MPMSTLRPSQHGFAYACPGGGRKITGLPAMTREDERAWRPD